MPSSCGLSVIIVFDRFARPNALVSRYRQFLQGVCTAGADLGVGESVTDVSPNDWSILRCRVEEGFSRVSKVLEDGTIQVCCCRLSRGFHTPRRRFYFVCMFFFNGVMMMCVCLWVFLDPLSPLALTWAPLSSHLECHLY